MLIAAPGDQKEIKACMQYIVKNPQPSYLRLAKSKNLILHDKISNLRPGKWLSILEKKNSKKTFLTTGNISYIAKNFLLKKKFNNYSLFSLPIWGMKFKEKQKEQIKKWEHVVVLEDHLEDGGFGSWIKESINNTNIKTKITSKHIDKKVIGKVGSEKYLLNNFYLKSFEK